MNLYSINCGHFKLDGGAMFGVVPKSIWNKLNAADESNMCSWALRSWLIEDAGKLILVDCGMGNKQSEKFFGHYYLHGDDNLDKSLAAYGFHRNDITDVFLTHLHFDHCGGAIVADGAEGRLKANAAWATLTDEQAELYQKVRDIFDPFHTLNPGVKEKTEMRALVAMLRSHFDAASVL